MKDLAFFREKITAVTGVSLPDVETAPGPGLHVAWKEGSAALIEAEDPSAVCRGLFRLARAVRENRKALDITERRRFSLCGVMLDMSRGAVLKPEAVKQYMDLLAALGMNMIMLYTEDTYEIPAYPYFGYLRGRYTREELKEIDRYGIRMGIQVIPCIQTLGHLGQFLQWGESRELRDQPEVLLVGEEAVYRFIREEIRTVRECFSGNLIHIGMDEAHGIGLGRWAQKHGFPENRFDLLNSHLKNTVEICREFGFSPIMWSDMYFRLGSETNDYYDSASRMPQAVADNIPEVCLCYWDYYHDNREFYADMLKRHRELGRKTSFAGGIWTWSGFLPQLKLTEATLFPALQACSEANTEMVFATMWGDDGAETDYFLAAGSLPMLSEFCWQGPDVSREEIDLSQECLTGIPRDVYKTLGEFYPEADERYSGKAMIWSDPLFPVMEGVFENPADMAVRAKKALENLAPAGERPDIAFARCLFRILLKKGTLLAGLRDSYCRRDRQALADAADKVIPDLICEYEDLIKAHRNLWEAHCKRPGWEVLVLRYGAVKERLADAAYEIRQYLNGEIPSIEALEYIPLRAARDYRRQTFRALATPQYLK